MILPAILAGQLPRQHFKTTKVVSRDITQLELMRVVNATSREHNEMIQKVLDTGKLTTVEDLKLKEVLHPTILSLDTAVNMQIHYTLENHLQITFVTIIIFR